MIFLKTVLLTIISCALCDTNYRLNTKVIPSEYEIIITPYFNTNDDRAFTFDGQVTIKVSTAESGIKQIKLHSEYLKFNSQNITVLNNKGVVPLSVKNPLESNNKYAFIYINLDTPLLVNVEYQVKILYRGSIRDDFVGLLRSSYVEKGQTKWFAVSQFQPTHARKAFPCFDEPQLKAKFTLVIDRPINYSPTISNAKLQSTTDLNNGYIRERFYPTPKMSTYLVAILISEFSGRVDSGDELSVWARPSVLNQLQYAFSFGKRALAALGNYFGIDYYSVDSNLQMSYVGIPEMLWTAIENWGMIEIKDDFLTYAPYDTMPYFKFYTAQTIAHETTHMWFGNLVTCHWWSDTWLNEGLATYFQDFITNLIEPGLGTADVQVTSSIYGSYVADEVLDQVPLTNNDVNSPDEIDAQFNSITYDKGGSIIRMIHHWIGDGAFKFGLNKYLNTGRFSVVTPCMLYSALDAGVNYTKSLTAYPGYTVAKVMSAWVSQAGHPLLNVKLDETSGKITLTQSRFYANKTFQSNELYPIPITYTTQSAVNFDDTKPAFIMAGKTYSFGNFSKGDWIIFNLQETGYYRVNYDEKLWSLIREALLGTKRDTIHYLNRAKIINDLFVLTSAELMTFKQFFDMLEFLTNETNYSVWIPALRSFHTLRDFVYGFPDSDQIDIFIKRLLQKVIQELGFDARMRDSFVTLRHRMQITRIACDIGYAGCVEHAVSIFRAFVDKNIQIAPSMRPVVYCQGLKHGTPEDYDLMYQRRVNTTVVSEARVIDTALSCTPFKEKLNHYLEEMILKSSLTAQTTSGYLLNVLADKNNFGFALEFLKKNYAALKNKINNILSFFPSATVNASELTEYETWLKACTICVKDEVKIILDNIQSQRNLRNWRQAHLSNIIDPLKEINRAHSK